MSCPACGKDLDMDPDGGWCEKCQTYWSINELNDRWAEEETP